MRFPWISREHHAAVLAGKDEVIAVLRAQIAQLVRQAQEPVNVTVKLPENFAMVQPALVRSRRPRTEAETPATPAAPEFVDWGNIDENDNDAIARIAARELGGPVSPYILNEAVKRIKAHIREARLTKRRNAIQSGSVLTQSPVQADPVPAYVPEHIQKLVESAERV